MKTVKYHRYAKAENTAIYEKPTGVHLGKVTRGTWLGVIDHIEGWYKVVTTEFDGWVKMVETKSAPGLQLSVVHRSPGAMTEYALRA